MRNVGGRTRTSISSEGWIGERPPAVVEGRRYPIGRPVSRVLSDLWRRDRSRRAPARTVISLGVRSPGPSSSLPAAGPAANRRLFETGRLSPPIWPCSGWGLPCRTCYQMRGGLLPDATRGSPPFHPYLIPRSPGGHRRCVFCGTVRRTTKRCAQALPGSLPMEPGLSSANHARGVFDATVRPRT